MRFILQAFNENEAGGCLLRRWLPAFWDFVNEKAVSGESIIPRKTAFLKISAIRLSTFPNIEAPDTEQSQRRESDKIQGQKARDRCRRVLLCRMRQPV